MNRLRTLGLFVTLFGFWLLLSWRLDPLFLVMGLGSAAVVTWLGKPLLDAVLGDPGPAARHVNPLWLARYSIWLVGRLPMAGWQILRVVVDPRRSPQPGVVRFRTELASPAARTMLATSITMVPGTMTLDVNGHEFTVHAFAPAAVADLANAATQQRIAKVFGYPSQPRPELRWDAPRAAAPVDPDLGDT